MISRKLLLALMCIIISFHAKALFAEWHKEEVDKARTFDVVLDKAIAIGSDGVIHIAYGGNQLYYAFYDGTNCVCFQKVSDRSGMKLRDGFASLIH